MRESAIIARGEYLNSHGDSNLPTHVYMGRNLLESVGDDETEVA